MSAPVRGEDGMNPNNDEARKGDPEYRQALDERRELRAAAKRDGTPEPPQIKRHRKTGEIVYSKTTTTEVRLRAAQRASAAAEMKAQRFSWDTIAQVLGYKNGPTARKSVERYIERLPMESVNLLRRMELEDLDRAETALADRIEQGDTQAIDTMLKIKHQRARLIGLYDQATSAANFDIELTLVQTTTEVVRLVRTHPDMTIEQILAAITTGSATD
ncbi:hypothetical protein [Microbacterium sp. H1-D42]|uniref:hypothetical protein n=1 Tax=Microbacterium sp. H1-D42 TaxID=2925844 RepID=UPI001F53C9C2|nr:hypothetical protein [Microbacterium sp. H1-D42]UNK71725.1 hypothetical protein MNR00_04505 [Microbacterium sp. H1-D42]